MENVLSPAGIFTWILEDNRGHRLADVAPKLTPTDSASLQAAVEKRTASDGVVAFSSVLAGSYILSAEPKGFNAISIPVKIVPGQPGDLTTKAVPTGQ